MRLLSTIIRVLEAVGTAVAVVFGLVPDPTLVPIEVPAKPAFPRTG
ncbi:MAG: hypothetical protein JOZ41_16235 [Chloroflexi bacterium]|nr:hypothetical protein [Chloroflexota bacterium]